MSVANSAWNPGAFVSADVNVPPVVEGNPEGGFVVDPHVEGDSDEDAIADEDIDDVQMAGILVGSSRDGETKHTTHAPGPTANGMADNDTSSEPLPVGPVVDQAQQSEARAKLRKRSKSSKTVIEYESEEDDGLERNIPDYVDSTSGEDELDSDGDAKATAAKKTKESGKKAIKTVKDLPIYAQHAYVASTYGLPKLPVPMVLLPGLRSRKPPPIPVPDLTKRSRGRHVVAGEDDGRKYHCTVAGCDKRFARGEHLKRHIRSIHTHEKPHQCPYPGCLRGFSRTDNMMQHMRTHDDWPDDETAAKIIAETEKKAGKKAAAAASAAQKAEQEPRPVIPAMAAVPWQVPHMFINWARPNGTPMIPVIPAPGPPNQPSDPKDDADTMDAEADEDVQLQSPISTAATGDSGLAEFTKLFPSTNNGIGTPSAEQATIAPGMVMMSPMSPGAGPSTAGGKRHRSTRSAAKAASKAITESSTTGDDTPPAASPTSPTTSTAGTSTGSTMSLPIGLPVNLGAGSSTSTAGGASQPPMGWAMPAGIQYPFMPSLPPGTPFPPPAIAIPIPPGAQLPHPTQLPPNAQLIPDPKGGHTVIIPPPPLPWGMPFPPGMLPMSGPQSPVIPKANSKTMQ